ncbi:MAG: O-antigen ligase family protein [Anaerolineaceae bacterium]|nr:MAG: O-antigen ligase family protein [Anaerolineaceae bacterium]
MRTVAYWLSLILIFTIPWENIVDLFGSGTVSTPIGLLAAAFWIGTVVYTGKIRRPRPFHLVFLLFICWNVVSVLWSIDVDETTSRLQTYVLLFGLVYIIWDLFTGPKALEAGLQAYVLGAWISVGSLMINFLANNRSTYSRFTATGFGEGNLGITLALGIPIAWHLATSENRNKIVSWLSVANVIYVPAALFAIVLTASRGSLFTALPGLLFILASFQRLRVGVRVLVFLALVSALFLIQPLVPKESIQRLATADESIAEGDLNGRVAIWEAGLHAFTEHPILGVGSSAFRRATEIGKMAHNSYLSVLVETGIPGFILFATTWMMAVIFALHHPKHARRFWLSLLVLLAIGIFSLNWAHRKQTWLFPSLVVVSASLTTRRIEDETAAESQLNIADKRLIASSLD